MKEDLVKPYDSCYIGVTNNLLARFNSHKKSKYTIGRYIRKYNLTFENMIVIFSGSEKECFERENKYRPLPLMGLNEASGGHGGYTSYTLERNRKISSSLEGRDITWNDKISATKKKLKQSVGEKNGNASTWKAYSPNGNEYIIHGTLDLFCKEHNLLSRTFRYYIDNVVPPPSFNGYGGFRAKNDKQKILRLNTTGWKLTKGN